MLRGAILRPLRLCRLGCAAAGVSGSRPAIAPARQWRTLAAAPSLLNPMPSYRGYHDAAAEANILPVAEAGQITKFSQLSGAGVHPNLEAAITRGMGFEDMTDVQSLTLKGALSGKDVFVPPYPVSPSQLMIANFEVELRKRKQALARPLLS
jgi:ATP-dependent RNA helicase MSS116, mitochondrial